MLDIILTELFMLGTPALFITQIPISLFHQIYFGITGAICIAALHYINLDYYQELMLLDGEYYIWDC